MVWGIICSSFNFLFIQISSYPSIIWLKRLSSSHWIALVFSWKINMCGTISGLSSNSMNIRKLYLVRSWLFPSTVLFCCSVPSSHSDCWLGLHSVQGSVLSPIRYQIPLSTDDSHSCSFNNSQHLPTAARLSFTFGLTVLLPIWEWKWPGCQLGGSVVRRLPLAQIVIPGS